MPRVEIEEAHEEIEPKRRGRRDDEICKNIIPNGEIDTGVLELRDHNVQGAEGCVNHDYRVNNHTRHEHSLRPISQIREVQEFAFLCGLNLPLRTITHGKDELRADQENASEAQNNKDIAANAMAEGI